MRARPRAPSAMREEVRTLYPVGSVTTGAAVRVMTPLVTVARAVLSEWEAKARIQAGLPHREGG